MSRYVHQQRAFTLLELLVSLAIVGAVMAGTYSGFRGFSEATRAATNEVAVLEDVSIAADLLRRDLQSSGWGLPKVTRVVGVADTASANTGVQVSEATFGVDINGDGDTGDTISTDRLFVSDGLKIITDTAPNVTARGYYPDGEVEQGSMLEVADAVADGGQKATLTAQSTNSVNVSTTNVNYDTESCKGYYSGITYNLVDIRANHAIIFGGDVSGGGFAVEGHRISAVGSAPANAKTCTSRTAKPVVGPATSVTFVSGETVGATYSHDSSSVAVPAVVWEVRRASDGTYWLYRNQHKVLPNVVDFQLAYGLDPEWDGLEWADSVMPTSSSDLKQRPEHHLPYLASDDPAYPRASSGGELSNYFGRDQEVIESVRTVWMRITVLRNVASEDSGAENTVASSYVNLVNLRN